ncbi:MAG: carboxypeptidase-like regulatory domain-containing protein [Chlorobi bacterium]|nr:carboxypeptidase-like regulatory domain-containing protein [Chlorobiota bacterium]
MRIISIIALILLIQIKISGQEISGRITDSKTNKPLEYVSIGIINTNFGTITDSNGFFKFEAKGEELSIVRISMIGYKPQKFTVKDLRNNKNEIKLNETTIELAEIMIKPTKERKVGATSYSRSSGWSGWGGLRTRKGFEIGIMLDLGNEPVKIKNLNVLLKRQSFDKTLFRLHIRAINDTLISEELLTENIIFSITKESGWAEIDLEPYNIILSGKVGVTLEWLDVIGNNPDRAIKINKRMTDAYVLFKNRRNHFGIYRWGTESKWIINKKNSPSMYLTIRE